MENFIRHLRPLSMSPPEATTTNAASEPPPPPHPLPALNFEEGGIKIRYPSQIGRGVERFFWGVLVRQRARRGDRGGRREGTHGSHNGHGLGVGVPEEEGGFLSVPNMQMPAVTTFSSSLSAELAGAILSVFASLFPLQSMCEK